MAADKMRIVVFAVGLRSNLSRVVLAAFTVLGWSKSSPCAGWRAVMWDANALLDDLSATTTRP